MAIATRIQVDGTANACQNPAAATGARHRVPPQVAQEFPFRNGPLDPSLHSNKIFFKNLTVEDVGGVWSAINYIGFEVMNDSGLRGGGIPLNDICQRAAESGVLYSWAKEFPQTQIVLPGGDVEGELGKFMSAMGRGSEPTGITEMADDRMVLADGSCFIWRPYFDWEIGKAMYLRNRRLYLWDEDNGQRGFSSGGDFCVYGGIDHPYCSEGSFIIDGQEKTGVILEVIYFYECVAGPCLELPHSLPGFVKTQGWQPRN